MSGTLKESSKQTILDLFFDDILTTLVRMPKIIPSFEHTLTKKIEALEAEVAQLRVENQRQKKLITELGLQALGKHPCKSALSTKTLTVETLSSDLPSYLRPTVASTNRAAKPTVVGEGSKAIDDRLPMYIDGKLVVINNPRPHYELSTLAKGSSDGFSGDTSTFGQEKQMFWVTHPRPSSPKVSTFRMHHYCESCNELDISWKDESAHSLAARTRLNDAEHNFQDSAAACVNIPYRTQHRLLHSAFILAQDLLWHHLRKHCPSRQIEYCFEGPREVAFCRSELLGLIAGVDWNLQNHAMTSTLVGAMVGVTDLRNTLAHQNRVSLAMVDVLITRTQKLAVVCGDEKRAMKARRLRDELRMHAEKAVADIIEKYHGTWGPFQPEGRQWALHQQRTFHDLIDAHESKQRWRYDPAPEIVKTAAWEWEAENRGRALGSLNHEYIAAFESASARLVETGRMTPSETQRTDGEFEESEKTAVGELVNPGCGIQNKTMNPFDDREGEALNSLETSGW